MLVLLGDATGRANVPVAERTVLLTTVTEDALEVEEVEALGAVTTPEPTV